MAVQDAENGQLGLADPKEDDPFSIGEATDAGAEFSLDTGQTELGEGVNLCKDVENKPICC